MSEFVTIPNQIDGDYRKYALYVIQSRGIPNFYDGLTPVQRIILQMCPSSFEKTLGVVGAVFKTGRYHHGDMSLSSAICKLARPFGCSDQILLGDGFFGSPVNPSPSAPRYTQVKISPKYKSIIEKHMDINIYNEEDGFDWLHVEIPIGLCTHIVGIAVGYRSNILPRRMEDIEAYLSGEKSKKLKPHFRGFKGKVSKVDSLKSSWLIEGNVLSDIESRTISIDGLSPLQRYDSFMSRLNNYLDSTGFFYKITNSTTDEVKMSIKLRCTEEEFKKVFSQIKKDTQQIVTENIVMVRDGNVMEYESIEEYLNEFSVHKELVILRRISKDLQYSIANLEFLEAKLKFLIFMSEKKRSSDEIVVFLSQFVQKIRSRLESVSLIRLNIDEIKKVKDEIKQNRSDIENIKKLEDKQNKKYSSLLSESSKNSNRKAKKTSLLDNYKGDEYFNGIKIWNPEEDIESEFENDNNEIEDYIETK